MKIPDTQRIFFIFLIFLFLATPHSTICAQQNNEAKFEVINNTKGLNSDYISGIVRDDRGFMWFATIEGLCRYDGFDIKTYSPFLSDGTIAYTKEIRTLKYYDGLLWMGSIDGIVTFNPTSETFHPIELRGMETQEIIVIEFDKSGSLWIGTEEGLYVYRIKEATLEAISPEVHSPTMKSKNIKSLYCDSKNNIWIGYWLAGLTKYNRVEDSFESLELMVPKSTVLSIYEEQESGDIYVGTWNGGIHLVRNGDKTASEVVTNLNKWLFDTEISVLPIFFIHKDTTSENYWIGTNNGLYVVDSLQMPKLVSHITVGSRAHSISNNSVSVCMYDHRLNILWFGTRGGGVNLLRLSPPHIRSNSIEQIKRDYGSGFVKAIYDDGEKIWLSIRDVGLFVGEKQKGVESPRFSIESRYGRNINTILRLSDGKEIWLGNQNGGITIIDTRSNIVRTDWSEGCDRLSHSNVITLYEDSNGGVWIGCDRGLMYASKKGALWHVEEIKYDKSTRHRIVGITESRDGYIWIATRHNGVYRIDYRNDKLFSKHYNLTIEDDVPFNNILTMYYDSSDNLWLGTSGLGLQRFDTLNNRFHYENSIVGKSIGTVNSIIEYGKDELWIGTTKGAYYYNRSNPKTPYVQHYTHLDGLIENICVSNSVSKGADGNIYIGAHSGYTTISPEIYESSSSRQLVITDICVNNQSILYPAIEYLGSISRDSCGTISQIELDHSDNNLTFSLSTLTLSPHSNVRYLYKMEGVDKDWTEVIKQGEEIRYENLSWGRYQFRAKMVSNNANLDHQENISIGINITRPFYASWWAVLLYISIIGYVAYDMITNRRAKQRLSNRLKIEVVDDSSEVAIEQSATGISEPPIEGENKMITTSTSQHIEIASPGINYKSINEQFLSKAIGIVNDNLDNSDFELTNFIDAMHTTRSMLYRKLKSMTGMSPNEFIRHIRLEVAHKLIVEKCHTMTIYEVAYTVGFNDPKHFTKCFKKQFGTTPSQFRDSVIEELRDSESMRSCS